MFPTDALTISAEIPASTASSTIVTVPADTTYTFLASDLHQSSTGQDPSLSCGGKMLNKSYNNTDFQVSASEACTGNFVVKSANNSGSIFYSLTYVPRDLSTTTGATSSATSTPDFINTYTAGDVVLGFLLLCAVCLLFAKMTLDSL